MRRGAEELPAVNAEIDGDEIVYKHYYDIGIAVGDRGRPGGAGAARRRPHALRRDREARSPSSAEGARDGKLTLEDLQGGTFSITNGGIYGSLMSTPILNPPQTAILGMHKIQERPVVRRRPDRSPADDVPRADLRPPHRRRARGGSFLVRVKECIEDPRRLLLDL